MRVRSERGSAIAAGVLYLVATLAGVASKVVGGSAIGGPGVTGDLAAHEAGVIAAALCLFVMAVAVAGIAFMVYPILMQDANTKVKEGLAAWYLGSRITEGTVFIVALMGLFSLLALSGEVASAAANAAGVEPLGIALWTAFDYAWMLGSVGLLCWCGAALLSALHLDARTSVAIGLGSHRRSADAGSRLLTRVHRRPELDVLEHSVRAAGPAGDGACGVADRTRIQPARASGYGGGTMTSEQAVLLVGGTGRTGGRVLQQLLSRGVHVRAIVRSAQRLPAGVASDPRLDRR